MFVSRYLALQLNHAPLQVEQRYMEMYPPDQFWDRRIMNAMSTFCEPRSPPAFAILCQREEPDFANKRRVGWNSQDSASK